MFLASAPGVHDCMIGTPVYLIIIAFNQQHLLELCPTRTPVAFTNEALNAGHPINLSHRYSPVSKAQSLRRGVWQWSIIEKEGTPLRRGTLALQHLSTRSALLLP